MKKFIVGVLAALSIGLGLLCATPAQASPSPAMGGTTGDTSAYLAALKRDGIPFNDSTDAIQVGQKVCGLLQMGIDEKSIVNAVVHEVPTAPKAFVTVVVTDAHTYLCPDATPSGTAT
jgi:hypothetical protein